MMWPFRKRIQQPKDHYVFISYTRREKEAREVLPLVEHITRTVRNAGYGLALDDAAWWDVDRLGHRPYPEHELREILIDAINRSHSFTGLISPQYCSSEWCRFEFDAARAKSLPKLLLWWRGPCERLREMRIHFLL